MKKTSGAGRQRILQTAVGIGFMLLLVLALDGLVKGFALPLPATVLAMAALTVFFIWNKGVPGFLDAGARGLFRIFPLLFIPALVSTVEIRNFIAQQWVVLLLIVTFSTFAGLVASVLVYRMVAARGQEGK